MSYPTVEPFSRFDFQPSPNRDVPISDFIVDNNSLIKSKQHKETLKKEILSLVDFEYSIMKIFIIKMK